MPKRPTAFRTHQTHREVSRHFLGGCIEFFMNLIGNRNPESLQESCGVPQEIYLDVNLSLSELRVDILK